MKRSLWKGPYIHNSILKKINKVWNKSTIIVPRLLNKTILVYNGKEFIKILIKKEMFGHKIGEFIAVKKRSIYKKKIKWN